MLETPHGAWAGPRTARRSSTESEERPRRLRAAFAKCPARPQPFAGSSPFVCPVLGADSAVQRGGLNAPAERETNRCSPSCPVLPATSVQQQKRFPQLFPGSRLRSAQTPPSIGKPVGATAGTLLTRSPAGIGAESERAHNRNRPVRCASLSKLFQTHLRVTDPCLLSQAEDGMLIPPSQSTAACVNPSGLFQREHK